VRRLLQDGLLVFVLAALYVLPPLTPVGSCPCRITPVGWGLVALATLPLLVRRRFPLTVLGLITVAFVAWALLGHPQHPLQSLPALVCGYSVATASPGPLPLRALAFANPAAIIALGASGRVQVDLLDAFYFLLVFIAVWLLGENVRARRAYTAQLDAAQRELARAAVFEERARIARELHDIVAHAMSVITVQAGVGAHVIGERPDRAAEALRTIEHTGRQALSEMRRMLEMLRSDDADDSLAPQPGLDRLPDLVRQVEETGVRVTVDVDGAPRQPPASVDLSAYRIVQESLTNAVKHAAAAAAHVGIRYADDHLDIEVTDDGSGALADGGGGGTGQGLRGMVERVALFHGDFEAGPRREGGFRGRARLPSVG